MRRITLGLVVVTFAIIGTLVYQSASSSASSFSETHSSQARRALPRLAASLPPSPRGALTEDDGILPDGVTVFDDEYPGVADLNPDLLRVLRAAATDAADDGIQFDVNSGWRSAAYQDQLLREAVSEYGSKKEAARWVATADTSAHVSGDAVDVGPVHALTWLSKHGAHYGLCQIYGNEAWHYELRPTAVKRGCPPVYPDPAHVPGTQR